MCVCVKPITVRVVSKNKSNCLLENRMVSTSIWRHQIIEVCSAKHFIILCHRFRFLEGKLLMKVFCVTLTIVIGTLVLEGLVLLTGVKILESTNHMLS